MPLFFHIVNELEMFNLFKLPIKKETLEAWAKILEDLTKLGIIGIVALTYSPEKGIHFTHFGTSLYTFLLVYSCLLIARKLRDYEEKFSSATSTENAQ